jgi:hypothetical protein
MSARKLGLAFYWVGGLYIFAASWLVMWWLAPYWRANPYQTLEGTAFAFAGPVFMAIALSVPVGLVLVSLGMALYSGYFGSGGAAGTLLVAGLLAIAASVLVASTMPYYPNFFGILGGAIMVLFLASVWYWGRVRAIEGSASPLADAFQLFSYLFFYLSATTSCAMLGNPYGGLFFPETVLAADAMPYYYAMGTKIAVYLTLGFAGVLASQVLRHRVAFAAGQTGAAQPAPGRRSAPVES